MDTAGDRPQPLSQPSGTPPRSVTPFPRSSSARGKPRAPTPPTPSSLSASASPGVSSSEARGPPALSLALSPRFNYVIDFRWAAPLPATVPTSRLPFCVASRNLEPAPPLAGFWGVPGRRLALHAKEMVLPGPGAPRAAAAPVPGRARGAAPRPRPLRLFFSASSGVRAGSPGPCARGSSLPPTPREVHSKGGAQTRGNRRRRRAPRGAPAAAPQDPAAPAQQPARCNVRPQLCATLGDPSRAGGLAQAPQEQPARGGDFHSTDPTEDPLALAASRRWHLRPGTRW